MKRKIGKIKNLLPGSKQKIMSLKFAMHIVLLLLPALSFAQGTVSGPTSCYPYVWNARQPNTFEYTLNYTPRADYYMGWPIWSISNGQQIITNVQNKVVVGWNGVFCGQKGSIQGSVTYYHNPTDPKYPDITITTAKLEVNILCFGNPTSMTGTFSVPCNNNTAITYCTPAIANANSYDWTYPSGWVVQGLANQNCITLIPTLLTPGTTSAQICVRAENTDQGLISGWYCKTINPRAPSAPAFINPILSVCTTSSSFASYNITSVSGATSYSWSGADFGRPQPTGTSATAHFWNAGISTITASAVNACGATLASINVEVSTGPPAVPAYPSLPSDMCILETIVATTIPDPAVFSYAWRSSNQKALKVLPSTQPSTNVIAGGIPGNYTVYVKASNSCGTSAESSNITSVVQCNNARKSGVDNAEIEQEKEISVFPNPANTSFEINLPGNESLVRIKMSNMEGQVIRDISTNESRTIIQTSGIPAGLYIVNISSDNFNKISKMQIVR